MSTYPSFDQQAKAPIPAAQAPFTDAQLMTLRGIAHEAAMAGANHVLATLMGASQLTDGSEQSKERAERLKQAKDKAIARRRLKKG